MLTVGKANLSNSLWRMPQAEEENGCGKPDLRGTLRTFSWRPDRH